MCKAVIRLCFKAFLFSFIFTIISFCFIFLHETNNETQYHDIIDSKIVHKVDKVNQKDTTHISQGQLGRFRIFLFLAGIRRRIGRCLETATLMTVVGILFVELLRQCTTKGFFFLVVVVVAAESVRVLVTPRMRLVARIVW